MSLAPNTDPRVAASWLAMEKAFAWYAGEVPAAKSPPLSLAEATELGDALKGAAPWRDEHFDRLMTFGAAMHRLARMSGGEAPDCNVGDLLTVLDARQAPSARSRGDAGGSAAGVSSREVRNPLGVLGNDDAWTFQPAVDQEAFAKLAFRETTLGITGAQRENREGWWAHGQKNRQFIEQAAARCETRKLAVALGAGRAFDLPLLELARAFDRLVLIDIDAAALEETKSSLFKDEELRRRVETRTLDLTGVNGTLVRRLEEILAGPGSAADLEQAVERLCRSYHLATPPRILPAGERADLLVSSCVLTQLAWPQRPFAERLYDARFGRMGAAFEQRWSTAWTELGLRMQQDHINALADAADLVVLTSDVVSHPTTHDAAGIERPTGRKILALGVESLLERIPRRYRAGQHASWKWNRYRPARRGGEGSIMDVEGVELQEPRSAGGLWLPG